MPAYAYFVHSISFSLYFFMISYDEALHCTSHKRNKFSLVNQLTLDKYVFKAKLQLPQSFSNVTGV